ncbi:E3 ubiquitin-protein ligase TRIM35-like [Oncorhynchus masou masou]|uniref:E3 ubiquitin-protein ligase TRIM35-like n=1 Tax=Oncorhynchus masou masou TaxID=90313 RepID=UPI003182E771
MAATWTLEDDMSCPVCCDVFTDPVVLGCSHSFCRSCLDNYWNTQVIKKCPVCRKHSLTDAPPSNLALRNIVETLARERSHNTTKQDETREGEKESQGRRESGGRSGLVPDEDEKCSHHGKRLLLFCVEDQEALCAVCQTSRRHRTHQLCPVDEAAQELKEEVKASIIPLRRKLETFQKLKEDCMKTAEHIKSQAKQAERKIRDEFVALHQFLRLEEVARLSALSEEVDIKTVIMAEKIEHLAKKMTSLTSNIREIEQDIDANDLPFLQAYKNNKARANCTLQDPEPVSGALIDMAQHLGNLRFKIWEKMQEKVQYTPVTMDPNTAAPWLSLSDDLTSVCVSGEKPHVPNNPERCDTCVCVLGADPFSSGSHCWEVEVAGKTRWDLGVLRESVSRKGVLSVNPAHGFWALSLRDGGQYSACTRPWTRLTLKRRPRRVRVFLDYDAGEVTFYDPSDMSLIYTFRDKFKEPLLPYLCPCVSDSGRNAEPLKICPAKVSLVHDVGDKVL